MQRRPRRHSYRPPLHVMPTTHPLAAHLRPLARPLCTPTATAQHPPPPCLPCPGNCLSPPARRVWSSRTAACCPPSQAWRHLWMHTMSTCHPTMSIYPSCR